PGAAAAAGLQRQHQRGLLARAATERGLEAKAPPVTMQICQTHLGEMETRVPHQRAVAVDPQIASVHVLAQQRAPRRLELGVGAPPVGAHATRAGALVPLLDPLHGDAQFGLLGRRQLAAQRRNVPERIAVLLVLIHTGFHVLHDAAGQHGGAPLACTSNGRPASPLRWRAMTTVDGGSLRGRVALITGANTGIGLVTARELVARGAQVFIACRSLERAQAALATMPAGADAPVPEALPLDLGRLDSVRQCARAWLARGLPLHLLINNAGLAGARGLTGSGFELAFGVNHIGHFLLTQLLLERLRASAPARIVTAASKAHYRARGLDWAALRRPTATRSGLPEYSVSKLANVLFSAELARRLAGSGVTTYALHPGVVASDVW